jgi:hypothetical protein
MPDYRCTNGILLPELADGDVLDHDLFPLLSV